MRLALMKFVTKKALRVAVLTALVAVTAAWVLSYFSYGLVGREAYSGIGTELMTVRGQLVFWRYNAYRDQGPPPQSWALGSFAPTSRMGQRLQEEYNFSEAPHFWQRAGLLVIYSDSSFGPGTLNLLISIPYVLLVTLLLLLYYGLRWAAKHEVSERLNRPSQVPETTTGLAPRSGGSS